MRFEIFKKKRQNKSHFKKKITLMLVPHDAKKTYQLNLYYGFIYIVLIISIACFAWAFHIISKDIDYHLTFVDNQKLKSDMASVMFQVKKDDKLLNQVAQLNQKLRIVLGLGSNRKEILEDYADNKLGSSPKQSLIAYLSDPNYQLTQIVRKNLEQLHQEALKQEKNFKQIHFYLKHECSLLLAKPSIWPIKGWITSGFGERISPINGQREFHYGVDIANQGNTPIHATADGIVTFVGWERGFGRVIIIKNGYGYSTLFAHCSKQVVHEGQRVKRGEVIGYVGETGWATGYHLHYQVMIHGVPVNPMKYLPPIT
jgi:murein DD-endopeptidase MepM/ murein hydrolase activator NlpD